MNIKKLKEVVNSNDLDSSVQNRLIIEIISKDKKVIPIMLELLQAEREIENELLTETNSELSRALVALEIGQPEKTKGVSSVWVVEQIKKHYLKWQDYIKCNFKIKGLP